MKLQLDPASPVPLYAQIAEALSYRIATGRIAAGASLPPLREFARELGVNLHTVRRAYLELAARGLVRSDGARGTRVSTSVHRPGGGRAGGRGAEAFLARVVREGREKHGWSQSALASRIRDWSPALEARRPVVHVIECSESQARDHAREIEAEWDVEAKPWCLAWEGEVPAGPAVATYFHYNDIRHRWPQRAQEIRFVAIRPDPALLSRVTRATARGGRRTVRLVEFDREMAANVADDLASLLPPERVRLEATIVKQAGAPLRSGRDRSLLLYTPRIWAALTEAEQADARVAKITYLVAPEDMENLGNRFSWRRKTS